MKDLMLLNGNIYTMDLQLPKAEAVAIKGSSIIAVGKNSEVENLGRTNFEVINLEGRTIIPGLIDCHTHFLSFAYCLKRVKLDGINSFDEVLSVIKSFSRKLRPDEWLVGGGWDKNILGHESIFTKEILDKVWPEGPAVLQSKDHHLLWLNSKALQAAGIDKDMGDPRGGRIERDQLTGEPTGILKENACSLVWEKVPRPSVADSKELLKQALKIANSYGLTGIHDLEDQEAFTLFQQLLQDGDLSLRICFWIPDLNLASAIDLGIRSSFGNADLRFGGVKMYSDGTLGSQTALMFEPYEGSEDNFGIEVTSEDELTQMVEKASRAGISVAIHSIGDKGVHQALNAIEGSVQENIRENRLRHRIEHAQLLHRQDVERFQKLKIGASVQPVHAPSDKNIAEKYWGERCRLAYAYKTLLKSGARVVFGSDVPIESLDPWKGIHAAVTRHRTGEEKSWFPDEKVSVAEAVSAYTQWASYASYEENLKGSIQVGKLADMVILSRDIFQTNPEEIPDTKVECTILGGRIIFEG
jgi:predicted amidohydrolase YtcJ